MKHSKIFLGATTCLLAIVGVAATRAHKFSQTATGFYATKSTGGACTRASVSPFYTSGTTIALTKYNGLNRDVYTLYSATGCPGHTLWSTFNGD